jgi:PAN domain
MGEAARLGLTTPSRSTQCSVMQPLQAFFITCVVVSITSMLVAPAMAGYSNFVFAQQADSPGNDYKRIGGLSFDECVHSCDADTACNAFTYNQLKRICFLKSAAAQWTIITLGAITGIRLSPFSFEGETKQDQSPVQDENKQ